MPSARPAFPAVAFVVLALSALPDSSSAQVRVPQLAYLCESRSFASPSDDARRRACMRTADTVYTTAQVDKRIADQQQQVTALRARVDSLTTAAEKRENEREARLKIELKQSLDSLPARVLTREMARLVKDQVVADLVDQIGRAHV